MRDKLLTITSKIIWVLLIASIVIAFTQYKANSYCVQKIYGREMHDLNKYAGLYCTWALDLNPKGYWESKTRSEAYKKISARD